MELRLRGLSQLDARAVQLPHGTEVVTRKERVLGERSVPQGAVGRVVKLEGDEVDVAIVGVGVVRYARDELVPRKVGQLAYAIRRAEAWDALKDCVVLETVVGSRAWGLADASSDEDRRGVFALPFSWSHGLAPAPEDLVSESGSETYWSVGKSIRQALRADPNTLEMLFVPGARALDPIGAWMLEARDAFVSREIHGTFGRYAIGQLRRLEQGLRLTAHRHDVLAWLRAEPALPLDDVAARLAAVSPRAAPSEKDALHEAKLHVKQLYRSLFDQGLLASNDFSGLVRFAATEQALELPRELRPKNAYNLLRLIATATAWLRDGTPTFAFGGELRERLLAIKRGEVAIEAVLAQAEAMTSELEDARVGTSLPERPDLVRADALVRRIEEEVARRWVQRDAGPFGRDAKAPPEIAWRD